jgi:hypothetical protein
VSAYLLFQNKKAPRREPRRGENSAKKSVFSISAKIVIFVVFIASFLSPVEQIPRRCQSQ